MAGNHTLPELPYAYNALEPHIDEQTMRLHHGKHHAAYVAGLNKAEQMLEEARKSGDFGLVQHWERQVAFQGSGHFNHTLFWNNMCPPDQYADPSGDLLNQINKDFGSFEAFKAQFSAAAKAVEGGGWAFLCWQALANQLTIVAVESQQKNFQSMAIPLLGLDVWEHAYYLKYQNNRASYVDGWWNIVNWRDVQKNFDNARKFQYSAK